MTRPKTRDRASAGALAAATALLCLALPPAAAGQDPPLEEGGSHEVMRTGAGYALRANNSSLPALLTAVGAEEGFTVVDSGKIHLPITANLDDAPLDVLLRRLLRGSNYIIVYRGGNRGTEISGKKIEQIILLTGAGLSPTTPSSNNGSPLAGPQVAAHAPGMAAGAAVAPPPGAQPPAQPRRLRPPRPTDPQQPGEMPHDPSAMPHEMQPGAAPFFPQVPAVSAGPGAHGAPFEPGALGVTGAVGGESGDEPPPPDDATLEDEE